MSEEKKYWHEIPQSEITDLVERKVDNQFVVDNYLQPDWCNYPDALMGIMGCWSLTDNSPDGLRTKISSEYCKTCPECKHYENSLPEMSKEELASVAGYYRNGMSNELIASIMSTSTRHIEIIITNYLREKEKRDKQKH